MTFLVSNTWAASKQGWSATNGWAPEADDPPGVSKERKNKVGVCVLSTSGTSWVSKHGNKLFSCLKKHCKIHINNTKWYQTYVIHHQTHSYFFYCFPPRSLLLPDQRDRPSPFNRRPRLFPVLLLQIHTKQIFMRFLFPILEFRCKRQTQAHGGYNAARLFFFFFTSFMTFF